MAYNPERHHRRSIRLRDYDYSSSGAYFVTICTHQRECLFGDEVNGDMQLNELGQIVESQWRQIPEHYPAIQLDEFIVMPNHVHGIICINDLAPAVGEIVRAFKARCTHAINQKHNNRNGPLWQRNYYDRVIRDDQELILIRQYVANNAARWSEDENNPAQL